MARTALLLASLASAAAHLEFGNYKTVQLENEVVSFLAVGEWGGQDEAPFTTPGQTAVAGGMAGAVADTLSTFVLSPGGNFYGQGIQGSTESAAAQMRLADTWNGVYNTPYPSTLGTLPWYTVAGAVDWAGNVTAEMGFNGTNSGQFIYPDLFYTFQTVIPFSGDTVEFIMIDTESLIGGLNPQPEALPSLYFPPPGPSPYVASVPAAAATLAASATPGASAAGPAVSANSVAAGPVTSPYTTAPAPASAASLYGRRRRLQDSFTKLGVADTLDDPGSTAPYSGYTAPSVNEAQWNWVQGAINGSYADWIIVVGNHPVWSAGEWGPTWPLVDRLGPMMEAAGVALYIGGKDHQMAHFKPVPSTNVVDYLVLGNGAYSNASSAGAHAADCPFGGLQFQYAAGTGFANIRMSHTEANMPGLLKVSFYDATGSSIYEFYKENPRTVAGHTIGNLGAPPSPSPLNANADGGGPMVIVSSVFIVMGVSMGLWIIVSHAMSSMGYRTVRGAAYGAGGLSEKTPLVPGGGKGLHGVVNL